MTALQEFQRLECTGLWRDAPGGQRREVFVSFGDATLVLSEARSMRAVTHWSLPAILRLNPGEVPARYAPGPDADEELELDDDTMIAAIDKVHSLIAARRPHPGRLRNLLLGAGLIAVLGAGTFWMPHALMDRTAAALPEATRAEIGRVALADIERLTGPACNGADGAAALDRLRLRVAGDAGQTVILAAPLKRPVMLPGRILALPRTLIEAEDRPEPVAAAMLAAEVGAEQDPPLRDVLRFAGFRATIGLLTSGTLPPDALTGFGETAIAERRALPPQRDLVARFAAAGLSTAGLAATQDPGSAAARALLADDPHPADASPVMTDTDWVALQGICIE